MKTNKYISPSHNHSLFALSQVSTFYIRFPFMYLLNWWFTIIPNACNMCLRHKGKKKKKSFASPNSFSMGLHWILQVSADVACKFLAIVRGEQSPSSHLAARA